MVFELVSAHATLLCVYVPPWAICVTPVSAWFVPATVTVVGVLHTTAPFAPVAAMRPQHFTVLSCISAHAPVGPAAIAFACPARSCFGADESPTPVSALFSSE